VAGLAAAPRSLERIAARGGLEPSYLHGEQLLENPLNLPDRGGGQAYPWRVPCRFQSGAGFVALDQIRTVDGERLVKRLGRLAPTTIREVQRALQELFAE